jgi:phospholipid transport system substrate-binding protein
MTIKRNKLINTQAAVLIIMMVLLCSSAWAGPATEQIKGFLNQAINILNDPSLKAPQKKSEKRQVFSKLGQEIFDWEELAKRALGKSHWQKATKEEKPEFVKTFQVIMERTYFDKIDTFLAKENNFSSENILYLNEKSKGPYTVVETQVKGKDSEIPVHYLLKNKQENWFICDIAIEGISIVKNYRAQFNEILATSSIKDLIAKLKSKQQDKPVSGKKG